MYFADRLELKRQALNFVFPGENAFDGTQSLYGDFRIEGLLSSPLGPLPAAPIFVDIGNHRAIEDGFSVQASTVAAIHTEDGFVQIKTESTADTAQLR